VDTPFEDGRYDEKRQVQQGNQILKQEAFERRTTHIWQYILHKPKRRSTIKNKKQLQMLSLANIAR